MKICLTGSEGFIGTHLKERLLEKGHQVVGIDNLSHPCNFKKGTFIKKDILSLTSEDIKGCNYIIHLAAQINVEKSLDEPVETTVTNLIGTLRILELSKKHNIPMIFASTTEIYGDMTGEKIPENHPTNPKSPYAASKLGADGLCKAYFHSYGTKVIIVRNFNTFGKYQSNDKWGAVIAKFTDRLINNKAPIIFGDGTQERDFMGYKDAIDFYMLCLEGKAKFGEEYNIGLGNSISINELADKIIKIFGKEIKPIHIGPRPGEVKGFKCDNTKALKLGWNPNMDFDRLLKEYIDWKIKYDNPRS